VLSNSNQQLLLVITNGRKEVHARTLTSVCKDRIRTTFRYFPLASHVSVYLFLVIRSASVPGSGGSVVALLDTGAATGRRWLPWPQRLWPTLLWRKWTTSSNAARRLNELTSNDGGWKVTGSKTADSVTCKTATHASVATVLWSGRPHCVFWQRRREGAEWSGVIFSMPLAGCWWWRQ